MFSFFIKTYEQSVKRGFGGWWNRHYKCSPFPTNSEEKSQQFVHFDDSMVSIHVGIPVIF